MNIDQHIREIVVDELSKVKPVELQSVDEFCRSKKISRTTLWRAEKEGKIKFARIGRRIFINTHQFHIV